MRGIRVLGFGDIYISQTGNCKTVTSSLAEERERERGRGVFAGQGNRQADKERLRRRRITLSPSVFLSLSFFL